MTFFCSIIHYFFVQSFKTKVSKRLRAWYEEFKVMQTSVLGSMLTDFAGSCGCRARDLSMERKDSPAGAVVAKAKSAACLEARGRVTDDRFCAMVVKCLRQRGMLQEETQVGLILLGYSRRQA